MVGEIDHVISLATETKHQAKKRASSASVIRGNKFVGKLLNMSVLQSELGGSIPMQEDSAKLSFRKKTKGLLHDFMNSVDMRIVQSMQADKRNSQESVLADLLLG